MKIKKTSKFNMSFWLYSLIALFTMLLTIATFILSRNDMYYFIIEMIDFNAILTGFFTISLAYLGINASERLLARPIYDNKQNLVHTSTKFSRKKFVAFIWLIYAFMENILVFRLTSKQIMFNLNIGSIYTYLIFILSAFFYAEQYKNVLLEKNIKKENNEEEKNGNSEFLAEPPCEESMADDNITDKQTDEII